MDRIDRRKFLGTGVGAASLFGVAANAPEQGNVANSRPASLDDDGSPPANASDTTTLTAEDVRKALERGIDYLKSKQLPDGTWPNQPHYDAGLTPLCTLALLNAGCHPETDEPVRRALNFLRRYTPRSTYTASLQTMALCAAQPTKDIAQIARNVKWLEARQHPGGKQSGMWSIAAAYSADHTDNSMSHFAMLALNEAERVGIRVSPRIWTLALEHWQNTQNEDGSWGWGPGYPGSGSMTCAGIAALIIASGALNPSDSSVRGEQVIGCGIQEQDPHFERAMAWLERYFSVYRNPGTEFWLSYYLYALERAARMTARRFIGKHDWYREGARMLVSTQEFLGAWPSDVEFHEVRDKCVSTSFSLMFLAKGRWPVVMAHLQRKPTDDWNRHRNALANLVGHLEKSWERNLTHQVVDLERASVEDLLEAPVLFLNGREYLQLTPEDKKKLRMYVDRGGFLFAERCCGGNGFDVGFREAMRDIFPEAEFKLRPLEPDHPVWLMQETVAPNLLPPLWGIDVSCRTGVIYCPEDLSCYWELDRLGRDRPELSAVQDKVRAARNIGLNILAYATGREVSFKNPAILSTATTVGTQQFARGTIYVANVLHPGGCHAAPAALGKLLQRAAEDFRMPINPLPHEVGLSDPTLFEYPVVFFHGRSAFELTPIERTQLRQYLERGGTVLADAVCSNKDFARSFRNEMNAIFPSQPLRLIPASDPIFTSDFGGADVTRVSRRSLKSMLAGSARTPSITKTTPLLEGLEIDGRQAVIFSPLDISCSLETEPMSCEGYIREDAFKLAMNILLYSLNQ